MYQIRSGTGCGETLRCSKRSPLSLHGWCQMQPFFMQAMNHQMLSVQEFELLSRAPAWHRPAYVASLFSRFWSRSVSCVVCLFRCVNFATGICMYLSLHDSAFENFEFCAAVAVSVSCTEHSSLVMWALLILLSCCCMRCKRNSTNHGNAFESYETVSPV